MNKRKAKVISLAPPLEKCLRGIQLPEPLRRYIGNLLDLEGKFLGSDLHPGGSAAKDAL